MVGVLVYLGLVFNMLCFRFGWFACVCFVLVFGPWVFTCCPFVGSDVFVFDLFVFELVVVCGFNSVG